MLPFIASRLVQSIPLFFGATIIIFTLMRLIPGDPAIVYGGPEASPETIDLIRKDFGLDKPLPLQYIDWMSQTFQGNLGNSYLSSIPVLDLLKQRLPATIELTIAAMIVTIAAGLMLGILAAIKSGTAADLFITAGAGISIALPNFWLGILGIYLFSQVLGWLPPGGRGSDFVSDPFGSLKYLVLPTLTLSTLTAAGLSRLVKSSMLEVLHEDYVRTARAKGLTKSQVIRRHVLRNALVPIMTVIAFQFGRLLGGAVIIEAVFAWPGLGRLILIGVGNRDYAVVQGALLFLVFIFVFINLLTDVLYGLVDPRIKVGASAHR